MYGICENSSQDLLILWGASENKGSEFCAGWMSSRFLQNMESTEAVCWVLPSTNYAINTKQEKYRALEFLSYSSLLSIWKQKMASKWNGTTRKIQWVMHAKIANR